jgi:transmembrane protein TMEM260 (protein O-mannosyltransferase)
MPRFALGAAWVAALSALWVYVQTLSPTVAWVNQGEDSGDLLAAAATLGIPHPTGYPLFTLLGRVASLIPLGPVAFRINLVAALAGAASVFFLARLVQELGASRGETASRGSGAALLAALASAGAALAYAFSRGAWSQSVLAEVYTLNAAFLGAVLWSLARAERTGSVRHLCLAAFLFGLGLTNHRLLLATAPALALVAWRFVVTQGIGRAGLVLLPLLAAWGATLYLYLPVRAWTVPEFSWGVPTTPARFWWMVSGAQYAQHFFERGLSATVAYLAPGRLGVDFGWGLVAIAAGVAAAVVRRPGRAWLLWTTAAASMIPLAVYSIPDDAGYWMPIAFLAAALAGTGWFSMAIAAGDRAPAHAARAALAALTLGAAVYALPAHWAAVDASHDIRPWLYARRNLEAVEPNALVLSEYDGRTFALWFYKATEFRTTRPDVAVVYKYLLVWPWYQHHLARRYPGLSIPRYGGDLDAMMNRVVARNIRRRPVYLVRDDPALLSIFRTESAGYSLDPLYRVTVVSPESLAAW